MKSLIDAQKLCTVRRLTFDPHRFRTVFWHWRQEASVVAQVGHGFPVEVAVFRVIGRRIRHQVGPNCCKRKGQMEVRGWGRVSTGCVFMDGLKDLLSLNA